MKLKNLNLMVTDAAATVTFLEKYFGLRKQGGDEKFTVLFDDDGFEVEPPQRFHAWTFYVQATGGFSVEVCA